MRVARPSHCQLLLHFPAAASLERDFCRRRRPRQKGPEDPISAQRPGIGDHQTRELAAKAAILPTRFQFFDEKFELRRHDYSVNIAGGFSAAQLMLEYTEANGIRLPSKRRAYTRGPDRRPILDMLMVSIDISDVAFS